MQRENMCWDLALKTISDFALAVRGKNSIGWRMIGAVVPHAATPSMISPAA